MYGCLECKQFAINLLQPVGKMNEAKLSLLGTTLGKRFPVLASPDDNPAVYIMLNPSTQESLIVGPNQLSAMVEGDDVPPNAEEMVGWLEVAVQALVLSGESACSIRYVGHSSASSGNAAQSSMSLLQNSESVIKTMPGTWGVGLRFFRGSDAGDSISEMKIEPLVRDPRLYFVELVHNMSGTPTLREIREAAEELHFEAKGTAARLIYELSRPARTEGAR
jgi:hypothetical protein